MHSRILRAEKARSRPSAADQFQGAVRNHNITADQTKLQVLSVWFPAGSRTNPHTHPDDQLLIVTEGEIAIAIGRQRFLLQPGELMVIPKDVWHWHGATPYQDGCHLSIKQHAPGEWGTPPPEDQAEFEAYGDWGTWLEGVGNARPRP